jgi:hypothetical protein
MLFFHDATVEHLDIRPRITMAALGELARTQRRLGIDLPHSVREWYSYDCALSVLSEHSNDDPPIPVEEFALTESMVGPLIPIRRENQGVCTWAILLDGSNDPPVFVDVDSDGTEWRLHAQSFSTYVYTCVWDYRCVLNQPALVQAQNGPISDLALKALADSFDRRPKTFAWPGSAQYRFRGNGNGVLIWSMEDRADWFVGAADAISLEAALRIVWELDGVGKSFYDRSSLAKEALAKLKRDA